MGLLTGLKRGWMKKLDDDQAWHRCMVILHSSGELVICDSDRGSTKRINLDLGMKVVLLGRVVLISCDKS